MTRPGRWIGFGCLLALLATSPAIVGGAAASARAGKGGRVSLIGNFDAPGESADASPGYANAAALAIADLVDGGYKLTWERTPVSGTSAIVAQEAFFESAAKHPDAIVGFASSDDFVPVGPKVAATDVPFMALSSPPDGIRSGPSGGDNIFLIRPLTEQFYAQLLDFVCRDLGKQEKVKVKDVRVALYVVDQGILGDEARHAVERESAAYDRCEVVVTATSSSDATDLAAQVQQIRESGANVVLAAGAPGPTGALVSLLREEGMTLPIAGGEDLRGAVDEGLVQSLDNLWVADECVPELEERKAAKRFVQAYTEQYGDPPNARSAQMYDALRLLARAVSRAGHDYGDINRALARTSYRGVCDYRVDENNVLARSLTVYRYAGAVDAAKVLAAKVPFAPIPGDELAASTVETTAP